MKKGILITVGIVLLGFAGYVFVAQKSTNREIVQPTSQKQIEAPSQPSSAISIDTNDNLDQALQDLDQTE